jgi:hypothetical protein
MTKTIVLADEFDGHLRSVLAEVMREPVESRKNEINI